MPSLPLICIPDKEPTSCLTWCSRACSNLNSSISPGHGFKPRHAATRSLRPRDDNSSSTIFPTLSTTYLLNLFVHQETHATLKSERTFHV